MKDYDMKLTITEDDLREMPEELRRRLVEFLVEELPAKSEANDDSDFMPSDIRDVDLRDLVGWHGHEIELDEEQADLLWAHVLGKEMREFQSVSKLQHWNWLLSEGPVAARVLANLSYEKETDAPTPESLAINSGLSSAKRLGPQIGSINKAIRRITRNQNDRLANISQFSGVYEVKEITRIALRKSAKRLAIEKGNNSKGD
jgi:hypothetical protein